MSGFSPRLSDAYSVFAYCRGVGDRWGRLGRCRRRFVLFDAERPGIPWGCVFKPQAGERYTATVEIVRPDANAVGYAVKLLIKGGSGLAS